MLKGNAAIIRKLSILIDLCLICGSFLLVAALGITGIDFYGLSRNFMLLPLTGAIWGYLLYYSGMYLSFRTRELLDLVYIIFKTAFLSLVFLSGILFFLKLPIADRHFVAGSFIVAAFLLCMEKALLVWSLRFLRSKGYNYRNILIVGANKRSAKFIDLVCDNLEWGLKIVGIIDDSQEKIGQEFKGVKIIGTLNNIIETIHRNVIDEVMFIVPISWLDKIKKPVLICESEGISVNIAADFFDFSFARPVQSDLGNFPVISFVSTTDKLWHLFTKRLFDLAISILGLILLSPVFLLIALIVRSDSPGPVFFRQERVGLQGRKFTLLKFRTMGLGAEEKLKEVLQSNEMNGPVFKMKNDPRITRAGKFLRKFSLDELPQLWNVFKGDMSIVGPRPPLPSEVVQYDNWQRRRLSMRPGITCLWQVNGRNGITDFEKWVKLDLEYIDNWSLFLDTKIFFKTIPAVLLGTGAK